jgi:hypothetical protein
MTISTILTYTVADIMAAEPCSKYSKSYVAVLWAGREALTAREIAALDIPAGDRLWAILSVCLNDRSRRLFVCDCADDALARIAEPDPRSVVAVAVARRFATGPATAAELDAATGAARDAAMDAATGAAMDAARERYLSWDAAMDAEGARP